MPALEIRNLVKRYRNGTVANAGITLDVEAGEVFGLLGPNGAGKTTLVRQVLGLLRPTEGTIHLEGIDLVANPNHGRRNVGFLPQGQFQMDDLRVEELIVGVGRLRGVPASEARTQCERLIARLELGEFRSTSMRAASGGVKRLAAFAAAVMGHPRLLVLDEPTNDIDPVRRQLFWSLLAEYAGEGTSVLLVTHNLAEAERVLNRLAIIDRGRLVQAGTPASLRNALSSQLRLELSGLGERPHPALVPDGGNASVFLFDQCDLVAISRWLGEVRRRQTLEDFRIGPPSLDDVYTVAVAG